MIYYKLYEIPAGGNRDDKKEIDKDLSKKNLTVNMWLWKKVRPENRFIMFEVTEKEVAST